MVSLVALAHEGLRIAGLQVLSSWGLHVHHGRIIASSDAWAIAGSKSTVETTRSTGTVVLERLGACFVGGDALIEAV